MGFPLATASEGSRISATAEPSNVPEVMATLDSITAMCVNNYGMLVNHKVSLSFNFLNHTVSVNMVLRIHNIYTAIP